MRAIRVTCGSLLVGCFAWAMWGGNPVEAARVDVVDVAIEGTANCLLCSEWAACGTEGEHHAWDGDEPYEKWTRNGGAHLGEFPDCRTGLCWNYHGPACVNETDEVDYEGLRRAVAGEDLFTLSRMLVAQPDRMLLSVERSAIQVLDCTGSVVMHLPVSRAFTQRVHATF